MGYKIEFMIRRYVDYWLLAALSFMLGAVVIPSI